MDQENVQSSSSGTGKRRETEGRNASFWRNVYEDLEILATTSIPNNNVLSFLVKEAAKKKTLLVTTSLVGV